MIRKEQFDWAIKVSVQAYLNGTLEHGICTACEVGNLIAAASGYKVERNPYSGHFIWRNGYKYERETLWDNVFCTRRGDQRINPDNYMLGAKSQIDSTGYSWQELARIEYAFETAPQEGDWEYNGLMAVVDVLCDIHQCNEVKEETKALFVKA